MKKSEATFCRSALLLSFCENRLCLSQLIKKLNSTEQGALFRHFCVSKVITTAHAHKIGVIFHFFPRAFKQKKIKALRPKMTKRASRGSCLNWTNLRRKKLGSLAILRFFIFKTPLFALALHTKTGMLFGQHFDGEPPLTLNHVNGLKLSNTITMAPRMVSFYLVFYIKHSEKVAFVDFQTGEHGFWFLNTPSQISEHYEPP